MSPSKHTRDSIQLPMFDPIVIQMTQGYQAIVDVEDADLSNSKWYPLIRAKTDTVYAWRHAPVTAKTEYLHRIILSRLLERPLLKAELADHINGDGLDNRRENIRLATHTQNMRNSKRPKTNTSGYKGVFPFKRGKTKHWVAGINVNGKFISLGYFVTAEEAYAAYCEAAEKYFGEFKRLE